MKKTKNNASFKFISWFRGTLLIIVPKIQPPFSIWLIVSFLSLMVATIFDGSIICICWLNKVHFGLLIIKYEKEIRSSLTVRVHLIDISIRGQVFTFQRIPCASMAFLMRCQSDHENGCCTIACDIVFSNCDDCVESSFCEYSITY